MYGMGVISTNEWLKKDFDRPVQMMDRLKDKFNNNINGDMIYRHLQKHGMYSPNQKTKNTWGNLTENNVWEKTQSLLLLIRSYGKGQTFPFIFFLLCLQGCGSNLLKRNQDWLLKINCFFFMTMV